MAQTGNPNVYTIFAGKYDVSLGEGVTMGNTSVMLTQTNEVIFMGNCEVAAYTEGELILDLPEQCYPPMMFTIPVYHKGHDGLYGIVPLEIHPNGHVSCPVALTDGALYTGGRSFNIGGKWYASEGGESNG